MRNLLHHESTLDLRGYPGSNPPIRVAWANPARERPDMDVGISVMTGAYGSKRLRSS